MTVETVGPAIGARPRSPCTHEPIVTDLAAVPPASSPDNLLAALVEDALFEACTAALDLTAPLAEWHRAGRPLLFGDREPELAVAVHALADRLVAEGPIHAARALGELMPPDVWLLVEDEDPDDNPGAACAHPANDPPDADCDDDPAVFYGRVA